MVDAGTKYLAISFSSGVFGRTVIFRLMMPSKHFCPASNTPDPEFPVVATLLVNRQQREILSLEVAFLDSVRAQRWDCVAVDAARIEPVSTSKLPASREKNREFCRIRAPEPTFAPSRPVNSVACSKIPYAMEQGIF